MAGAICFRFVYFYLWNGDKVLATVGKGMVKSKGLMGQFQRKSPLDLMKEADRINGREGGNLGIPVSIATDPGIQAAHRPQITVS